MGTFIVCQVYRPVSSGTVQALVYIHLAISDGSTIAAIACCPRAQLATVQDVSRDHKRFSSDARLA